MMNDKKEKEKASSFRKREKNVNCLFQSAFIIFIIYLLTVLWLNLIPEVNAINFDGCDVKGTNNTNLKVVFFYSATCPHCHKVLSSNVLSQLETHGQVYYCLVSKNPSLFENISEYFAQKAQDFYPGAVPTIIFFYDSIYNGFILQGDYPIINFCNNLNQALNKLSKRSFPKNIKELIEIATNKKGLTTKSNENKKVSNTNINQKRQESNKKSTITTKKIILEHKLFSIKNWIIITLLGLSDSVNPCIMSVLALLLAQIFILRAKKRAKKVSLVFILTTYISYFVLGLLIFFGAKLLVMKFVTRLTSIAYWIKIGIIILILIAAAINIKDFFFYGKGVSFQLPKKYKTKITKLAKSLTFISVIIIAFIVTLVEFPCSGIMYLGLVLAMAIENLPNHIAIIYLIYYNILFVLPLILISYFAIKLNEVGSIEKFRLKYRRLFRLIMGLALLALAYIIYVI